MSSLTLTPSPILKSKLSKAPFEQVSSDLSDFVLTTEFRFHRHAQRSIFWIQQHCKRFTDIILASLGLLLLLPLFALIAIGIKLSSKGPIFYSSPRIGKHYQPFEMLKFRTMTIDADQHRERLRKQAKLEGNLFKLVQDPRITPFGQLLRATSMDELPQLINVIKGEMSLVGPRPLPPDEAYLFEAPYTLRYELPPGITGAWQVNGRSNLSFESLCQYELTYALKWNLLQDWAILFKTVPAVLLRKGAC